MTTVLVTGAAGYIGSVLVRRLLEQGYAVRGLDNLAFGGESLIEIAAHPRFDFVRGDIRDAASVTAALTDIDAVVHLAAIVGDPACAKQSSLAREVNWDASARLLDACIASKGVKRFIFSSTCSNYGRMESEGFVNEESALHPASLYAELKVQFERHLLAIEAPRHFVPTALRFATVYGLSPRLRFDLTVNEFVRDAALGRRIQIYGEQFWRPYCHVEDLSRGCVRALEAPAAKVRRRVFGVGDTGENYQKRMLADELRKIVPTVDVSYVPQADDPRDYRVDFSRIRRELGYRITRRVPQGMRELHRTITAGFVSDPDSARYRNV
jgi:nucleoside-diphosphate-sugar epimerase